MGKREFFKNVAEILPFLKSEGWVTSKTSLYRAIGNGKLRPNHKGIFELKAVQKYAITFLVKKKTRKKIADENLQRKKLEAETMRIEEHARLSHLRRLIEEGKYVEKAQADRDQAAMIVVMEASFRNLVFRKAADWIELVEGNQDRLADFQDRFRDDLDDMFREMARVDMFTITPTDKEGMITITTKEETKNG